MGLQLKWLLKLNSNSGITTSVLTTSVAVTMSAILLLQPMIPLGEAHACMHFLLITGLGWHQTSYPVKPNLHMVPAFFSSGTKYWRP